MSRACFVGADVLPRPNFFMADLLKHSASASASAVAAPQPQAPPNSKSGRVRWTICALLFFATTINYLDRQVLGLLAPTLEKEIGWSESQYASIVMAFTLAYGFGQMIAGALIDRFGTRRSFSVAIVAWSLAAIGHGFARSVAGFSVARFALGVGEAANFPAAIKTVAEWFPRQERALATGIFNSGSNVGALVAPLLVPFLALTYGWPSAFYVTGAVGFVWLVAWLIWYRKPSEHPRLSAAERAYIEAEPEADGAPDGAAQTQPALRWSALLKYRQTWALMGARALTDPVWGFYLFWLAKFLDTRYGISLAQLSLPLIVIYLVADFGSIGGGWLSSWLLARGYDANRARKTALLVCALCVVPVGYASTTTYLWVAVPLIAIAAAAHQGWSANLYTVVSDLFPKRAVASVVGLCGLASSLGATAFAFVTGQVLERTGGNYTPIFLWCGVAYLVGLALLHFLLPRYVGIMEKDAIA